MWLGHSTGQNRGFLTAKTLCWYRKQSLVRIQGFRLPANTLEIQPPVSRQSRFSAVARCAKERWHIFIGLAAPVSILCCTRCVRPTLSSVRAKMSLNFHNTHHSSSCCLGFKLSHLHFNTSLTTACLSTPSAPVCWSRASGCTSTGVWDVEDGGVGGQPWNRRSDSCVSAA